MEKILKQIGRPYKKVVPIELKDYMKIPMYHADKSITYFKICKCHIHLLLQKSWFLVNGFVGRAGKGQEGYLHKHIWKELSDGDDQKRYNWINKDRLDLRCCNFTEKPISHLTIRKTKPFSLTYVEGGKYILLSAFDSLEETRRELKQVYDAANGSLTQTFIENYKKEHYNKK